MRSGKRLVTVILPIVCSLLSMLLVACGSSGGAGGAATPTAPKVVKAPDAQQIYRWAFRLPDINSFDPGVATDITSSNAIQMVFTGLVQLDDKLQVKPQMAQSYDVSTDALTYTFHLRPNLKFSDGTKLDA